MAPGLHWNGVSLCSLKHHTHSHTHYTAHWAASLFHLRGALGCHCLCVEMKWLWMLLSLLSLFVFGRGACLCVQTVCACMWECVLGIRGRGESGAVSPEGELSVWQTWHLSRACCCVATSHFTFSKWKDRQTDWHTNATSTHTHTPCHRGEEVFMQLYFLSFTSPFCLLEVRNGSRVWNVIPMSADQSHFRSLTAFMTHFLRFYVIYGTLSMTMYLVFFFFLLDIR